MPFKDREEQRSYVREYMAKRRINGISVEEKLYAKQHRSDLKYEVFAALGGPICVNCGCAELSILEINHINGNGAKQLRDRGWSTGDKRYLRWICDNPEGFNVLCRICNALHDVQVRFGIHGHQVRWEKPHAR